MIELKATSEAAAKQEALRLSKAHPGKYLLVVNTFGLFCTLHDRLPPQAPSDTPFSWYVLNGKVRTFTEAQHVANQKATPALS
jgi:hypothetical protein